MAIDKQHAHYILDQLGPANSLAPLASPSDGLARLQEISLTGWASNRLSGAPKGQTPDRPESEPTGPADRDTFGHFVCPHPASE